MTEKDYGINMLQPEQEEKICSPELLCRYEELKRYLTSLGSAAVAFSGGVDSTFLLFAAKEALGSRVLAVTAASASFPVRERRESEDYCRQQGFRQRIVISRELDIPGFRENPANRCYLCKKELFGQICRAAAEEGMAEVLEGSNLDDLGDYRPGLRAIAEMGILSPLRSVGFTKEEIRSLSRHLGLPTWEKPSFACLASRFPYGEQITEEKLRMVDRGEQLLLELGFRQFRVRIHGDLARIELLPGDFPRLMQKEIRERVDRELKKIGFAYVSLDLKGYRTGSMNETLTAEELLQGQIGQISDSPATGKAGENEASYYGEEQNSSGITGEDHI